MNWELVRVIDLTRKSKRATNQGPKYTVPFEVKRGLIRLHVTSLEATKKPTWVSGSNLKWNYSSIYGIERWLDSQPLSIDVNRITTIPTPEPLAKPYIQFEIPAWINDAIIYVWTLRQNYYPSGESLGMSFFIPPSSQQAPTPFSPVAATCVNFAVNADLGGGSSREIVGTNANRKGILIKNNSDSPIRIWVGDLQTGADAPVVLPIGASWFPECQNYTGPYIFAPINNAASGKIVGFEYSA